MHYVCCLDSVAQRLSILSFTVTTSTASLALFGNNIPISPIFTMVRHWQPVSGCDNSDPRPDSKTSDVSHANDYCSLFEPVAIVGMAMRLPGSVRNAEDFWDMLIHKRSGQCTVPKSRYNIDAWYGPGKAGHVTSKHGYFLDDLNLDAMDTSFWSMTRQEVEALDPQQRLLLEVVYETFQSAGAKGWKDKNIGCYIGTFEGDWLEMDGRDTETNYPYRLTGYGDYMAANRISYEFGLRGPRYFSHLLCWSLFESLNLVSV